MYPWDDYYEYREKNREKFNGYIRKWSKTEKGKECKRKNIAKYNRNKKWIQILPNIFPEDISVDFHHIDGKIFVVPIPKKIHLNVGGKSKDHIKNVNEWVEFYYGIDPVRLIEESGDGTL